MVWKQLIQIVVAGGQVVGRALFRAIRQEYRASQQAAEHMRKTTQQASRKNAADMTSGISLQEAKDILNVSDIQDLEELNKNYKHLFEVNDKSKGGSLYLQSKVFRAKERIDSEHRRTNQGDSTTDPDKKTSSET